MRVSVVYLFEFLFVCLFVCLRKLINPRSVNSVSFHIRNQGGNWNGLRASVPQVKGYARWW